MGAPVAIFSEQTLKPAEVSIDTIFTTDTPAEMFNIQVQFTAKTDLPANTTLHIAVIEKEITDTQAMGTNGETSFTYVMKKLLPNALGTRYIAPVLAGTTETVNVSWSPEAYDMNQLAVIAFVQNENTKEIYQSRILETPTYIPTPGVVTGVEQSLSDQIGVFPNPADQQITVILPEKAQRQLPVILYDTYGKELFRGYFNIGEQSKVISTTDMADGVHLLQTESNQQIMIRKKVMVLHK
jgi:hypothetical protein